MSSSGRVHSDERIRGICRASVSESGRRCGGPKDPYLIVMYLSTMQRTVRGDDRRLTLGRESVKCGLSMRGLEDHMEQGSGAGSVWQMGGFSARPAGKVAGKSG